MGAIAVRAAKDAGFFPASLRGWSNARVPVCGSLGRTLPNNGSPGLLPTAIVTAKVCPRQVSIVTKVLQKSDFERRAGTGSG
jgi:hypothetical protein